MLFNQSASFSTCRQLVLGLLAALSWPCLHAEDLFDKNAPKPVTRGSAVASDSTIGGYPIYQGDNQWRFFASRVQGPTNMGVSYGILDLLNPDNGNFFVQMSVMVNLDQSTTSFYVTANPCGGEHLVKVDNVRIMGAEGSADNCLTVDPFVGTIGGRSITTLDVRVTNAQSSSRYYAIRVLLNPTVLGFGETLATDWRKDEIARSPDKTQFVGKVADWGRQLQIAVAKAIGFNKPKDAFKNVPSFRELRVGTGSSTTYNPPGQPQATMPAPTGKSVVQRLAELKALLDSNLISQSEYEEKRKAILNSP